MISAYKIGVELALTGSIGKALTAVIRQFETLNAAVQKVQGSVNNLQASMEKLGSSAMGAAKAWREAADAMDRGARAQAGGAGPRAPGGGALSGSAMLGGGAAGLMLGGGGRGGSGGGGGGASPLMLGYGGGRGGGGGGMPPLALGPGASPLSSHQYLTASMGFGAVGYGILGGERKAIDAAGEISHLRAMLIAQGVSPGAADDTINAARTLARNTPGLTVADTLGAAIDLKSVLGGTADNPVSMQPAMTALPAFAQTMSLLNGIGSKKGDPTFAAAKSQELLSHLVDEKSGGVSSEELQRNLDMANKVAIATNMRVGPTDYLAFAKQARIAGMVADDEFLYKRAPALIMEMGGVRAGTGIAAFQRQFMAGTMTENKFLELQKLGLFDNSAKWAHGQVPQIDKHLKNSATAYSDPSEWIWETLKPAMEKRGITDRLAQARYVSQFASTAPGGGFIASNLTQEASIKKEAANIGAAKTGGDALKSLYSEDFMLQVKNFGAAFHNFMVDVGGPLLAPAALLLKALTASLNQLGQWSHDYPTIAQNIAVLAGAFGLFAVGASAYAGIKFFAGPMVAVANSFALYAGGTAAGRGMLAILGFLTKLNAITGFFMGMSPSETNKGEADVLRRYKEMSPADQAKALDPKKWYEEHPNVKPPGQQSTAPTDDFLLNRMADAVKKALFSSGSLPVVVTNGKDLADGVTKRQTDQINRPMSGSNGPDIRMSPFMPGLAGGWGAP